MKPEISVVMAVYNAEVFLRQAIESILSQTFQNFEFIIVDDGSKDKSNEIIQSYKDYRIRLLEQRNMGISISLNNAIKISESRFIARMDSDDISFPNRLELQFNFLSNNPEYILVGTNAQVIDINGDFVYKSRLPTDWEGIKSNFPNSSFFHSSVMFRKSSFYLAGGYYEPISKLNCFEDSLLWNKMKVFGKMANIYQPLIYYRLSPNSATPKSGRRAIITNRIFKEILATGSISVKNYESIARLKSFYNGTERIYNYHIHLAKKYLWNSHKTQKARRNLWLAMKMKPFKPMTYFLFVLLFFPQRYILKFYRIFK